MRITGWPSLFKAWWCDRLATAIDRSGPLDKPGGGQYTGADFRGAAQAARAHADRPGRHRRLP